MPVAGERALDLVVFGATGYTGRLVAEYIASRAASEIAVLGRPLRWGIAGRDYDRLRELRVELTDIDPDAANVDIAVARVDDPGTLAALAERARVVITTVGPYARYGEPLLAACVEARTDYLDLTGEPSWWSTIVSRYHDEAQRRGVKVVPSCGFESMPADLGAAFTVERLADRAPEGAAVELDAYVVFRGTISGGTWQTALEELGRLTPRTWSGPGRQGQSPLERHREAGGRGPHIEPISGHWVVPLPSLEPLVVERSSQLLSAQGPARPLVRYRQYLQTRSWSELMAVSGAAGALTLLSQVPAARRILGDLRPAGTGPVAKRRARGWFRIRFEGREGHRRIVTEVRGGDPGYGETAKMVGEAGLLLASSRDRLPAVAGVLTPATAFGAPLRERLDAAGITFRLVERGEK